MLMFAFCQNTTLSHAKIKIAQSTELSQHVKQCVLATLKKDELVCTVNTVSCIA